MERARERERVRGDGGERRQLFCILAYLENYEIKVKKNFKCVRGGAGGGAVGPYIST